MIHILELVYSLPFFLGLIIGICGQRCYVHARVYWLNKTRPRGDGNPHKASGISRVWAAGLVTAAVLGYVLLQSEQTHQETVGLAKDTQRCQAEFNTALRTRFLIGEQNDKLSREQRALFAEIDEVTGVWINRLINPPPQIAALAINDPRRQAWDLDVTRVYFERTTKIREQVAAVAAQQDGLVQERRDHPLPEPTCGR